jgi:hypothetical protein
MNKVSVLQISNGQVINKYDDITTAARSVNGQVSHISECMRSVPHRNTHKGYEWRNSNEQSNEQSVTMGETKN